MITLHCQVIVHLHYLTSFNHIYNVTAARTWVTYIVDQCAQQVSNTDKKSPIMLGLTKEGFTIEPSNRVTVRLGSSLTTLTKYNV